MTQSALDMKALQQALMRAKRQRHVLENQKPPVGMGTNETGPPVETNGPPNAWPSDGDYS